MAETTSLSELPTQHPPAAGTANPEPHARPEGTPPETVLGPGAGRSSNPDSQQSGHAGNEHEQTLQYQTNLLPRRQLIIIFAGLSCALFCKSCSPLVLRLP